MPRFDVVGVGVAACDYLTRLERFPALDEKVRSDQLTIEGGGTIGTALVTVARLGRKAAFAGALGDDAFGRFVLAGLEKEEVDTTLVHVETGARSPFAFCVAVPPRRNVFSIKATTAPYAPTPREMDAILDCWFVHLDGSEDEAAAAVAREARKRGVGVSLDLQRIGKSNEALLQAADLAVVSESYAREMFGSLPPAECARKLWRPGMRLAAITLGERGAVACEGAEPYAVPAESVEVVDSTGAGDVFHGALLVRLLSGDTVRRSLSFATHVAALSLRAAGGRAGVPHADELGDWP